MNQTNRTRQRLAGQVVLALACVLAWSRGAVAEDWSRWRGPLGNGITESAWNPKTLDGGAKILWQANLGEGYSAVSIRGPNLYSMGNVGDKDIIYCLKADTGKEVWRYDYPCPKGDYAGPRATPVVDGKLVYTLSREGDLLCLNAANGALAWRRSLIKDAGAENIGWGFASSPVVVGTRLYVNAGKSGAAFDKRTGKLAWSSTGKGGHAAVVPYPAAKPVSAVLFSSKSLLGVNLANGKELWSQPWETSYDVNAADPIVMGDEIFMTSGYGRGCGLVRVAAGAATLVWENKNICAHFSSTVLLDSFIYGINGNAGNGELRCLEWATGNVRWTQKLGFGSLIAAGGQLIVLLENGAIVVAEAKPDAYTEVARAENAVPVEKDAKCWTAPVLSRGLLYARTSKGTLACLDLRAKP